MPNTPWTPCVAQDFIYLFIYYIFGLLSDRLSFVTILACFHFCFVCFQIIILYLMCFFGIHAWLIWADTFELRSLRRIGFLEHEPWIIPRFPAVFFLYWVFFPAGFFWALF